VVAVLLGPIDPKNTPMTVVRVSPLQKSFLRVFKYEK